MSKLSDLHNKQAGAIVRRIVKPTLAAGGDFKDILVLLESVVAGTVGFVGNGGGDDKIIDHLAEGAKGRVESMRADIRKAMN